MLARFEYESYHWAFGNVNLDILTHSESFYQKYHMDTEKPNHSHVYYELLFSTAENTAEFLCENIEVTLSSNSFVIISPYCNHRTVVHRQDDLFSVGFLFKPRQTNEETKQDFYRLFNDMITKQKCIIGAGNPRLAELFLQIKQYSVVRDVLDTGNLCVTFLMILFHILKFLNDESNVDCFTVIHKSESEKKDADFNTRIPTEIMSKVNNTLSDNFMTDVTPEQLSREYYISPKQINRYMLNQYGQTFLQRRNHLRMTYAGKLLRENDLTINEIAEKVGYHSVHSFYYAFKIYFGITPNQYRMGISSPEK